MPVGKSRTQIGGEARLRGERELEDAEAGAPPSEQAKARLAERGEEERAAEGAGAEDGRDQAEHVRVGVERLPRPAAAAARRS